MLLSGEPEPRTPNNLTFMNKPTKIELVQGDITTLKVDAIVNAANKALLGGGGVDGAIHAAAGPQLVEECKTLNGCETGEAKITKGYLLQAKYVIHTVGPVWRKGKHGEEELLASCYKNCLKLTETYDIQTIAFPNISTGVYGFPKELAAGIAIETLNNYLLQHNHLSGIIFATYDAVNFELYADSINKINR